MLGKETSTDRILTQKVTQQLINHGLRSPCQIAVLSRRGNVTLSGTIEYEHQRHNAVRTARGVSGVRRVIDQLHTKQRPRWS